MSDNQDVWSVVSVCSVCSKDLDDNSCPQLLPCCHSSCKDCIDDNLNQLVDFSNTNSTERPQFKCKLCSQEYSPNDCIENTFQLIYWSKKTNSDTNETQMCQSCEGETKRAVIKCEECQWICEECQELHKTLKLLKVHKLDESSKVMQTMVAKNVCKTHNNEEITVYCKTCRKAFCARCILKDHNLHVYEDTKDNTQLDQFYNTFNEKVEKVKEKRSFAENILQKFESIETEISGQREECILKIKAVINQMQEKVSELGTSLLDKVNAICQRKESEFNLKKTELNQLNQSFKFIEQFMAAVRQLNDPMAFMKSQDLLHSQLEKLLNKPCTHPDFLKAFKIDIVDKLSTNTEEGVEGQGFNVSKMIDGVFNMSFKIVTSDDISDDQNGENDNNLKNKEMIETDDELPQIIGELNPRTNASAQVASTQTATAVPAQTGQTLTAFLIRGNDSHRDVTNMSPNNTYQTQQQSNSYDCSYNNINANLNMQSHPTARPITSAPQVPTQRLHNTSQHLQNLNAMTNSVTQSMPRMHNNFVNQTGITANGSQSYGCPQVYRGPIPQRLAQNSLIVNNNVIPMANNQNYVVSSVTFAGPPNVSLQAPNRVTSANQLPPYGHYSGGNMTSQPNRSIAHSNGQTVRNIGFTTTTNPRVIYPASTLPQRATNSHLLARLNSNFQTLQPLQPQTFSQTQLSSQNQLRHQLIRQQSQHSQQSQQSTAETQKQREIQQIYNNLIQLPEHVITNDPLMNRTTISTASLTQTSETQSQNQTQTPIHGNRTYQLHIPDNSVMTPLSTTPPVRSTSRESVEQRRDSAQSRTSTPGVIESTNKNSTGETVGAIQSRSHSIDSGIQTPTHSMPILSNINEQTVNREVQPMVEKVVEQTVDKEVQQNPDLNEKRTQSETTIPINEMSTEIPLFSNPPSIDSIFSELSPNDALINCNPNDSNINEENINNNNNTNTEDNREPNTSGVRSTAPVARIAPITNETEESPEVIIAGDISDDNLDIDEDNDCVVCAKEYGEFICCAQCPRAFHCECHVPALDIVPENSFICTFCKPIPQMQSTVRTRRAGLNERQQLICEQILIHLLCHKNSQHFKPPFPDMSAQSLNLISIKKDLENKKYENEKHFLEDIKKVFSHLKNREITPENMESYNTLEKYFKKQVHKLLPDFSEALQNNTSVLDNNNIETNNSSKKSKTSCISI